MKQLVIFCMLLLLGFTCTFAQTLTQPVEPPESPSNQYVKEVAVDASIRWENGMGYATITLPFSLNNTISTDEWASIFYSYKYNDKTIEFTFNSPTPKITKVKLNFEDKNYTFGYMNTPNGHSYFAFKWKYIININFDMNN